tara:strand:+ start:16 stop:2718 length:2703 start_codon:yes stop_codon:yes gene_type:complete
MSISKKKLYLVDGMALIYRAHFAMINNPLLTKDGRHTSAIFGFTKSILNLLKNESPEYFAVVLDSKEPTFRHKLYPDYKANRTAMPIELIEQLKPIRKILDSANIPVLKQSGFEADDIMGTISKRAKKYNLKTYLVTSDKDMMQLVTDQTNVYSPGNRFKKTTIYNEKKVEDRWGIHPQNMVDYLALVGDTSDNIPGIDGIGPKTAKQLIKEYGTLENIIKNYEFVKNKRAREGLSNGRKNIYMAKELVTIDCNVPIEYNFEAMASADFCIEKMLDNLYDLEFHSLIELVKKSFSNTKDIIIKVQKEYVIINKVEDLNNLCKKLNKTNLIAINFQSYIQGNNEESILGIALSINPNQAYYISFDQQNSNKNDITFDKALNYLKPIFQNNKIRFCGHNLKTDCLILLKNGIFISNIYFDTKIAEYLIRPTSSSSKLDKLSLDYLNYKMIYYDNFYSGKLKQKSLFNLSNKDVSNFSCEVSDIIFQLISKLSSELDKNNLKNIFEKIEMPLLMVLAQIENTGIYLDMEYLRNLSYEYEKKIKKISSKIFNICDEEFNLNSPKQLAVILFDKLKLKTIRKRSTSVEVLEVLQNFHPLPTLILKYRHLSKLKSTYIDAFPNYLNQATKRIHTTLNQTVTSTGRLSSASPNFQNIPIRTDKGKEIRKAFIPKNKQKLILSADYSQIELRIMAHFSNEPELIRAFTEDKDVHKQTASLIYDISELEVTSEQRRSAKVVNFGIMYGAGPFRISKELGISMPKAKELIANYFNTYPGIKLYMDETISKAKKDGYVSTIMGRKRNAKNLESENKNVVSSESRAIINMPIQGTAADMIKIAMININNIINKKNLKSKMILQIHDELLFEVPKEEKSIMSNLVVDQMERAIKLSVPIKVDWNYGNNWLEAH